MSNLDGGSVIVIQPVRHGRRHPPHGTASPTAAAPAPVSSMVMETDGPAPLTLAEEKRKFDMPGELSAQLACSPYAACIGDDVN